MGCQPEAVVANKTPIEWADYSSNPLRYRDRETGKTVWACVKKSGGCTNCYSEALALRWKKGLPFARPNIAQVEPFLDRWEMRELLRAPELSGQRVFVGDMTDLFGSWVADDLLDQLFTLFALRADVTFMLLTKRPKRMAAYLSDPIRLQAAALAVTGASVLTWTWPLPNVWLGTSTEDQRTADERIPHLLATPAAVRFLSCEPLLGPVTLGQWYAEDGVYLNWLTGEYPDGDRAKKVASGLGWVIAGGESGPRHRPMDLDWARSLRDQCAEAGVSFFFKQVGGRTPKAGGRLLDGREWSQFPAVNGVSHE